MKLCNTCHRSKKKTSFHKDRSSKDGFSYVCKECAIEKSRAWYGANKDRAVIAYKKRYEKNKEQIKKKVREWCLKNPDKRFKIHRTWYDKNKEQKKIDDKIRYEAIKPHIMELAKLYQRKLRLNPVHRLSNNISRGITHSLYYRKNGRSWEVLVGYNIDQLVQHLECLFVDGMSWNNYGRSGWTIDHIIPISAFNYEKPEDDDFKKCWALGNLQPLWAIDNIKKGKKVVDKLS